MPKVLHIRCSGELLGAENVVLELASSSGGYDYESIIGIIHDTRDPYPELAIEAKKREQPYVVFPADKRVDLTCIKNIRNYIHEHDIDLIHTHGYRENIYTLLSCSGKKICATNHLWKKTSITLRLYALIDSMAMAKIDKIIAVSKPIMEEMTRSPFIRKDKISMISNGIDIKKFKSNTTSALKSELHISDDTLLLTTVSSLTPEKGHRYLLEALAGSKPSFSGTHTLIVGDGPERKSLERQVARQGLTKLVTLVGRRSDIDNIHAATDIYILPSLNEGLPMSLLEAMASGKPCIATDVGDVSKCIKNNLTGILVEPGAPSAIQDAIQTLIADPILRKTLGEAASTLISSSFSTDVMTGNYCDLYGNLLDAQH
jgi:glycosyltransferase involved in cell wall biosynthesis